MSATADERSRAGFTLLGVSLIIFALISFAGKRKKTSSPRKAKKKSAGRKPKKTRTFDGKGYRFVASHQSKAAATKAAARLRKEGQTARVSPFRWSAGSRSLWGVFVR